MHAQFKIVRQELIIRQSMTNLPTVARLLSDSCRIHMAAALTMSVGALAMSIGAIRRGIDLQAKDLALAFAYWPLTTLAPDRTFYQLLFKPYYWDKTPHKPEPLRTAPCARIQRHERFIAKGRSGHRHHASGHAHHCLEGLCPAR